MMYFNTTTTPTPLTSTEPLRNETDRIIDANFNFDTNPRLVSVLISCTVTGFWLLFITFYLSRLLGYILTKIANRFYLQEGYVNIGSFSFSLLTGKLMFQNIRYITKDYSVEIVDGFVRFKWWLSYNADSESYYKTLSKDEDICLADDCRLTFYLHGLEAHIYNRSDLYEQVQNILKCERYGDARKSVTSLELLKGDSLITEQEKDTKVRHWRDLFPVTKFIIRSGKLAIGNRLLETTLWIHINKGNAAYSRPDAVSSLDCYTHLMQCKCDDLRVLLSKSPAYQANTSEPPRFMGQGFVVLQAGEARLVYYQDEPGMVPEEVEPDSDPEWGLDVKFTKSVTVTYGPWVDKQREHIQKYFFPNSFQELPVTKPLEQYRLHTGFDVTIEFEETTNVDLLFTKDEETSALHMCCSQASSLHFYQPWVVNEYGYTSNIIANLNAVEITTSLKFRKLIQCDKIDIAVNMMVPRMWNQFQHWTCEWILSKTTCYYINEHQNFLNDLFSDWSYSQPADIAKFVPYEWAFSFNLRDFELILLVNESNWIETSNEDENDEFAICGEILDINFILPFSKFISETVETKFFCSAETLMIRSFIATSNTLRRSVISLAQNASNSPASNNNISASEADLIDGAEDFPDAGRVNKEDELSDGWRRRTRTNGWTDIWSVPVLLLNLVYCYYPMYVENDCTRKINSDVQVTASEPCQLPPDVITVTLEAGPSAVKVLGHFWKQFFVGFKGNYFGQYPTVYEFNSNREPEETKLNVGGETEVKDIRHYRPLEARITVILLDIHAELTTHKLNDMECAHVYSDKVTFEMHKLDEETRLQLITAPVTLVTNDSITRAPEHSHLSRGFLHLSGFQFRGHAMFSDKGLSLGCDKLEYAWLTEIQCGILTGRFTLTQLSSLVVWLNTFALHGLDKENRCKQPASIVQNCQHQRNEKTCQFTTAETTCLTEEMVKYKMTRVSLERINVFIAEVECACSLLISPVRFSVCNSKNKTHCEGNSLFTNDIALRMYVQQANNNTDQQQATTHANSWVEIGLIEVGAVTIDISEFAQNNNSDEQLRFLYLHDKKTKRVWFLWDTAELKNRLAAERMKSRMCGCVGGCNFFGRNQNGVRFFTPQPLDAASDVLNHYGSESLWGRAGGHQGDNVKERLMKLSAYINNPDSEKSDRSRINSKRLVSSITSDVIDHGGSRHLSKSSKVGDMARSRSLMITRSMRRFESDDGSFYSCNSENEVFKKTNRSSSKGRSSQKHYRSVSAHSIASTDSYASAVSSVQDILELDATDAAPEHHASLCQGELLSIYANYMHPLTCDNWRQRIPYGLRKKFSLINNLKIICPPGHHCSSPSLPHFSPNLLTKLPFVFVDKSENERMNTPQPTKRSTAKLHLSKKETRVNAKVHQQVHCVLTPIVVKALDRYVGTIESAFQSSHLCHILDLVHKECISKSEDKYLEHQLYNEAVKATSDDVLQNNLHSIAEGTNFTFNLTIPQVNLFFLQVSAESYITTESNSLNGECESEGSMDVDVKNTNAVLLAMKVSKIDVACQHNNENAVVTNTMVSLLSNNTNLSSEASAIEKLERIIAPDRSVLQATTRSVQLQVLHLQGNMEKVLHVTHIPEQKSKVDFNVLLGVCTENTPEAAASHQPIGAIITEIGMNGICVQGKRVSTISTAPEPVTSTDDLNRLDGVDSHTSAKYTMFSNSSSTIDSTNDWQKAHRGYIALDIDPTNGRIVESEPTISFQKNGGVEYSSQQTQNKPSLAAQQPHQGAVKTFTDASLSVKEMWVNLAAPSHLTTVQRETDQDVNLVTVLIPAISCWIPHITDLSNTLGRVRTVNKHTKHSVVACLMGQSLPKNGKLPKKHRTSSIASKRSSFLQEEYSSQLIWVLRRYTSGNRLVHLLNALRSARPPIDELQPGIKALARQLKCVIIGAENTDNIFAGNATKKPVVGRGVLTQKDLRRILNDRKTNTPSPNRHRKPSAEGEEAVDQGKEAARLLDDSDSEDDRETKKEETLYDWMSKSPINTPSKAIETNPLDHTSVAMSGHTETLDDHSEDKNLFDSTNMVSLPTSGMELADASHVFASLFDVIGLDRTQKTLPAHEESKINACVEKFAIVLSENLAEESEASHPRLFFQLNSLHGFANIDERMHADKSQSKKIKFAVNLGSLEQHINFSFVRFFMQVKETCSVVLEQKRYAQKKRIDTKHVISSSPREQRNLANCWKNMYNVMDLYLPKTSVSPQSLDGEFNNPLDSPMTSSRPDSSAALLRTESRNISGSFALKKAVFSANISSLDLVSTTRQFSVTFYQNIISELDTNQELKDKKTTCSCGLNVKKSSLKLVDSYQNGQNENDPQFSRVLMTCKLYKTNALHTTLDTLLLKNKQRTLLIVGPIAVDIPQHPGTLRRITGNFSNIMRHHFMEFEEYRMSLRDRPQPLVENFDLTSIKESVISLNTCAQARLHTSSIVVSAALLPSLRAEYKIEQVTGNAHLNGKVKFQLSLPNHSLSFQTKTQLIPLPASTHTLLPAIVVDGHYIPIRNATHNSHGYLCVNVNIGTLDIALTTDLLNHLIFFQRGFLKEVNEVVRDVEESDELWSSPSFELHSENPLIYSVNIKLEKMDIQASTPSNTGAVFQTGVVGIEFTNQNPMSSVLNTPQDESSLKLYGKAEVTFHAALGQFSKSIPKEQNSFSEFASFKGCIGVSNILKNKEAVENKETIIITLDQPQLYLLSPAVDKGVLVYLHFKNAYEHWVEQRTIISSEYPTVADHLFKRLPQQASSKQDKYLVLQVNINKLGVCLPLKETAVNSLCSILYVAQNLRIGMIMHNSSHCHTSKSATHLQFSDWTSASSDEMQTMAESVLIIEEEEKPCIVVTVQDCSISSCHSGSLASTGHFRKFRLQFLNNFDHTLPAWHINEDDLMNTYCIPEGSYQLCSKTVSRSNNDIPSKWLMTLVWRMCGVNIHVDSNIGKQLSLLIATLTTIVGDSDVGDLCSVNSNDDESPFGNLEVDGEDTIDDNSTLEEQLWIQTKRVNQLRGSEANPEMLNREIKVLQEIESALSVEFFKDVKRRFRRRSSFSEESKKRLRRHTENKLFRSHTISDARLRKSETIREDGDYDTVDGGGHERTPTHVSFSYSTKDVKQSVSESLRTNESNTTTLLDFELNIVVDIESGKCTLHTETPLYEDEKSNASDIISSSRSSKDGKFRLMKNLSSNLSSQPLNEVDENAVLLIPGVDARVNYLSVNNSREKFNSATDSDFGDISSTISAKTVNKEARLNAFVSIESLPKEMILRPSILEFIDKALTPIIVTEDKNIRLDESVSGTMTSGQSSDGSGLYSLPVDVVVLIRIDPSDIRFTCQPISKVECLLRIPSLDICLTSSPPTATPRPSGGKDDCTEAGFSCTVCLSRFAFCIFHPYGKQFSQQNFDLKNTAKPISGRKDSLSLNVEFIKFSLFRNRVKVPVGSSEVDRRTVVKVSGLMDIGSAAFNYDMRRLQEILDVPKAWYRRDLYRRMFLGKEGTYATSMGGSKERETKTPSEDPPPPAKRDLLATPSLPSAFYSLGHRKTKSIGGSSFFNNLMGSPFPRTPTTSASTHVFRYLDGVEDTVDGVGASSLTQNEWETLIVLACTISRLDISTNMGNVMGQASWSTNDFHTSARVLSNNVGVSTGNIHTSVRQGVLNTHGGVIGGCFELQDILAFGSFSESLGKAPFHEGKVMLKKGEIRLDYMGSCILMTSISCLKILVSDDWKKEKDGVVINSSCLVDWDELQLIVSRATAPDAAKMKVKIEEFFNQQKCSSARAFSSMRRYSGTASSTHVQNNKETPKSTELKYQQWIDLLRIVASSHFHNTDWDISDSSKVRLGGCLKLNGRFLSLACLHGSTFRAQNWGLFTVHALALDFSTSTKLVEKSCHIFRGANTQTVEISLGREKSTTATKPRKHTGTDFMGTVRKVSRGSRNPPALGAPVQEWLMFINTINANDLPNNSTDPASSEKLTHIKLGSGLRKVSFAPKFRYENDSEVVFGLPVFTLQLTTEHDQPTSIDDFHGGGTSPHLVETDLTSHFEDSICVAMDAGLYFYLHDLILSYMRETQASSSRSMRSQSMDETSIEREAAIKSETKYREFRSRSWKLEPGVRILSWAGQQMTPNIEWVLEKLGFNHANQTIPKWIQRGAFDPLDEGLAILMGRFIKLVREDEEEN